jgi:hypothetical protein
MLLDCLQGFIRRDRTFSDVWAIPRKACADYVIPTLWCKRIATIRAVRGGRANSGERVIAAAYISFRMRLCC